MDLVEVLAGGRSGWDDVAFRVVAQTRQTLVLMCLLSGHWSVVVWLRGVAPGAGDHAGIDSVSGRFCGWRGRARRVVAGFAPGLSLAMTVKRLGGRWVVEDGGLVAGASFGGDLVEVGESFGDEW